MDKILKDLPKFEHFKQVQVLGFRVSSYVCISIYLVFRMSMLLWIEVQDLSLLVSSPSFMEHIVVGCFRDIQA